MKLKYIIGIAVAVVFVIVAFLSLNSKAIEYANFSDAMASGKKVQVTGSWVKDKPTTFDAGKNIFVFYMQDKSNKEVKVVFHGGKPQNFEIANYFVATGKFENNDFIATEILTKCPSKYEGQIEDLKKQTKNKIEIKN